MGQVNGEQEMHLYVSRVINVIENLFNGKLNENCIHFIEETMGSYARKLNNNEKVQNLNNNQVLFFPEIRTTKNKFNLFKFEIQNKLDKMGMDMEFKNGYILLGNKK